MRSCLEHLFLGWRELDEVRKAVNGENDVTAYAAEALLCLTAELD